MVGIPGGWNAVSSKVRTARERLLAATWLVALAGFLVLACAPLDARVQGLLGATLVLGIAGLRRLQRTALARTLLLLCTAFLALRYLAWRTTQTLQYSDPLSFLCMIALYLAELYGIALLLVSLFVNVRPLHRRPVRPSADPARWPSVDILVPTYNESPELLRVTMLAALQVRYPQERLRVYLLDDGGTLQKRQSPDPLQAAAAERRHRELQAMCRELGAQYLTRERNEHAKAGNINAALKHTSGELILILDADHVPSFDILEQSIGWFERDPKLFLLQTPHFFLNPDPIEKNLQVHGRMPSENAMFYGGVQQGLDFWGSSFFCGSAAVLRRRCLEEIGGLCETTITEDAETALELHSRGYTSAYLDRPMIAGLQPETFEAFLVQRSRWAQGMAQIFVLKNPLFKSGLTLAQRLGYFNSTFFWLFGYARLVFVLAPVLYLLFGMRLYSARADELAGYALPHLAAAVLTTQYLFGRVRWMFVSELYELLQSIFSVRAITAVLLRPRSPAFRVTPKGQQNDREHISPYTRPFYVLLLLTLASLVAAGFRFQALPAERALILVSGAWALFNAVLLLGSLGVLFERRYTRCWPRMVTDLPAELLAGGQRIGCTVRDLSAGGVQLAVPASRAAALAGAGAAVLKVHNAALGRKSELRLQVRRQCRRDGVLLIGAELVAGSLAQQRELVALVYGSSERWVQTCEARATDMGIRKSAAALMLSACRHSAAHLATAGSLTAAALRQSSELLLDRTVEALFPTPARRGPERLIPSAAASIDHGERLTA
jgi:cellulose synthase (UDP-forming)